MKTSILALLLLTSTAPVAAATPASCPQGSGPREAVMGYLRAMHEHRFEDAYPYVTSGMTDGRSRADWSALQASLYLPGEVQIYGVEIGEVYAPEDDPGCAERAIVSNVLSSRDKLNEVGNVEFEIYHLRNSAGHWQIDAQETLFDDAAIATWFPRSGAYRAGAAD